MSLLKQRMVERYPTDATIVATSSPQNVFMKSLILTALYIIFSMPQTHAFVRSFINTENMSMYYAISGIAFFFISYMIVNQ